MFFKSENRIRIAGPNQVCYVDFFIRDHPEAIEEIWCRHETELGHFYECLHNGTLLVDEAAIATARSMLALHAARSLTYLDVAARSGEMAIEKVRSDLINDMSNELAHQIQSRTQYRMPITPALLLAEATSAVTRNSSAVAVGGELFATRLVDHFNQAREILEKNGPEIEVITPENPNAEFLISDDPVLIPSSSGDGRIGIDQGVGWLQAQTFAMPFSPRCLIAAAAVGKEVAIDDRSVDLMNELQIKRARKHVVTRPNSGLAQWASDNWRITEENNNS